MDHTLEEAWEIIMAQREEKKRILEEARQARSKEFWEMYKTGMTLDEIGKVKNLTRERVRQILFRGGYVTRKAGRVARELGPEEKLANKMYYLYVSGFSVMEISEREHCRTPDIYNLFKKYGYSTERQFAPR